MIKKNILNKTTLDPIQLSLILKHLKKKRIEFVILEASSHGLKQNRLDGLNFDIGIFTNLSHDHLDYHKTIKNYFNSKLYLFKSLMKKKSNIVSDATISQISQIKKIGLKKRSKLSLIFDKKGIDLVSHNFLDEKQILVIMFKKKKYKIELNLIGKIQIKNILMAILASNKSGIGFSKIINTMNKIRSVEGRLEKIGKVKNNSKVILDYAHTPEALELALINIKEQFSYSKISLVFGCGGNRDFKKRPLMGKIAEKYADNIYLTDDNPRFESPINIRKDIKKGLNRNKFAEIPNRKKAIDRAIQNLKSGDILLVAGKGHEKIQDYGNKKSFFSDREIILESIRIKNRNLSKDFRINIIKEHSHNKIKKNLLIKNISINSKTIRKNDVFFAIKGKRVDGNKFVHEALKKKSTFVIVNRLNKNFALSKQVKVKDTLNFLSQCSSIFRDNINAKIISITGSCGKTTLKEMIGLTLARISKTTFSPKSFNNKYGVPLSLFNLKQDDDFGVFEVGMDKKGEIDYLTKIIKPDLGIITNVSYAHSKNFENVKQIADAKAEIMNNIKTGGSIVLNSDDDFYSYHKNLALKKKLKVISFGIKNKSSKIKLIKVKKADNKYKLYISINGKIISFYSKNINDSNIYNILATLASINFYIDIKILKNDTFLNLRIPEGRGDVSKLKIKNNKINLVDETYNSNPLSLKSAIENYEKIDVKGYKKYLILGDMLELGKHSIKQHKSISKIINKTKINKVYVFGKYIKETFKGIKPNKKGKVLNDNFDIIRLIKKFNNGDYLMVKGSNSTGLNKFISTLKKSRSYAIWIISQLCWDFYIFKRF